MQAHTHTPEPYDEQRSTTRASAGHGSRIKKCCTVMYRYSESSNKDNQISEEQAHTKHRFKYKPSECRIEQSLH